MMPAQIEVLRVGIFNIVDSGDLGQIRTNLTIDLTGLSPYSRSLVVI